MRTATVYDIYKLTAPSGKSYIGLTKLTASVRFKGHVCGAKHGSKTFLSKAIRKYGAKNFRIEILAQCFSHKEATICERAQIAQHGTLKPSGYNLTCGGEGAAGYKHTNAAKLKIKNSWTPEAKQKQASITREQWSDVEFKDRMLITRKNQWTAEAREKKSSASRNQWTAEAREKKSKSTKKQFTAQARKEKSLSAKTQWADPEFKAKMCSVRKTQWTEEARQKQSISAKNQWKAIKQRSANL